MQQERRFTGTDGKMIQFEIPKVRKKVIAIDFDGTIVQNAFPKIGEPKTDVIGFMKRHRKKYVWILWTCRTGERLQDAIDYMKSEHGITFDYVNTNSDAYIALYGDDTRKVYADYYVDDKNANLSEIRG